MRTKIITASLAGIAAIAAGYSVLPRSEERAVAMMRDGNLLGALALYEDVQKAQASDPRRAMQIIIVNEEAGRPKQALEGLKRYVARWPQDTDALIKLANVAKSTMNTKIHIQALERLVALGVAGNYHHELLGLYRTAGATEKEKRLLVSLGNSSDLLAEDLARLGTLLENEGEDQQALTAFRLADQRASSSMQDVRFKLLKLLLRTKAFSEATKRATAWSMQWNEPALISEIATHLAAGAPPEYTIAFARSISGGNGNLDLAIAAELGRQGYDTLAFEILMQAARNFKPGQTRRFKGLVSAAKLGENPRAPLALLASLLSTTGRETDAAILAEQTAEAFGIDILYPLSGTLRLDVLVKRPLFGIQIALSGHNQDLARRILLLGTSRGVSDQDLQEWAEVMFRVLGVEGALHRIAEINRHERISVQTLAALETESMKHGLPLKAFIGTE